MTFILFFRKKTRPFVFSSYLCIGSYKLHENFQKYIGGVACCEYGINVCDFFANIVKITKKLSCERAQNKIDFNAGHQLMRQ